MKLPNRLTRHARLRLRKRTARCADELRALLENVWPELESAIAPTLALVA